MDIIDHQQVRFTKTLAKGIKLARFIPHRRRGTKLKVHDPDPPPPSSLDGDAPIRGKLRDAVEALEKNMLNQALEAHNGNRTHTAAALGLSRLGLLKKIRRYELEE